MQTEAAPIEAIAAEAVPEAPVGMNSVVDTGSEVVPPFDIPPLAQ